MNVLSRVLGATWSPLPQHGASRSSSDPHARALGKAEQAFASLGSVQVQEGWSWDSCLPVWWGGAGQTGDRNKEDGAK